MASEYDYKTSINVLGIDIPVFVTYEITSHGSADSWEEPGDPVEIEIKTVVDSYGNDMWAWCNENHDFSYKDYKPWYQLVLHHPKNPHKPDNLEPIGKLRAALFYNSSSRHDYGLSMQLNAATYLSVIHAEIISSDDINDALSSDSDFISDESWL